MLSLRTFFTVALSLFAVAPVSSLEEWNSTEKRTLFQSRSVANGVPLRILPLGDSITWGDGSSDGNSYRWDLFNLLSENTVTYIGSQNSGTMLNNNNEGHSGAIISEIATYAENSLPRQPNVVLVLAGTNDVNRPYDPAGAPSRLGSLIDKILISCPDAAILVAQIPPISDPAKNKAAQIFNAAVPGIVAERTSSGAKVLTVDMSSALTTLNLADGLHPNDIGYSLMAKAWYAGIQQAAEKGWIRAPIASVTGGNKTACSTYLYWDAKFGTIATGVGSGDAAFVSGWQPVGQLATGNVGINSILYPEGAGVRLADMNGDGRDDYLWVHPISGAVTLYINGGYSTNGGVQWISKGQIATGVGDGAGVIFADINGDGLDDYLWIAKNGDVTAYINGGEQAGGWLWKPLGIIAGGTGATRDTTRFGDIDGDGRADYFVVGSGGSLNGWLNYGYNDKPDWQPIGIIATGIGDAAGVFLYDLNNDGRADYIWLSQDGAATVYINNRGPSKGLAPTWVSAGKIATGVGASRTEIIFGDLNGDGKKDYVRVYPQTGAIDVWINTGTGGSYVVGDGTRFADMDGNGLDDYLAISPTGAILLYLNHGYDQSSNQWIWESQGQIATGVAARKDIRIADLNGDGRADYLVVNEKSGAVDFWLNGGRKADGSWSWTSMGQVATGIGEGAGVQFADIDGDGKADYLWVDKNGAVTAYLNGGSGTNGWIWRSQGIIATGVGGARQDIQFHDINGDGMADYLWVNRIDGSVTEWRNGGGKTGDIWQWNPQGQIATGVGANGMCIQFADTNGKGRADYLNIAPASGATTEWYNGCFGESSLPGGTETPIWQTAQCTDPGVTDAAVDPTLRWNSENSTSAWIAAVANWRANPFPGGLRFSQQVSNFFHGPESMLCGVTTDHNGCDMTVQCGDVNHPAGYFILNSFAQIDRMNMNFYDAIYRVEASMSTVMAGFSSTFAPIKDESAIDKLILDLVGLGYALFASPVWNSWLKNLKYFKDHSNTLGTLKDFINPLVSNAVTITKDTSIGGVTLNVQNNLEAAMGNLISFWAQTVAAVNENLFDGSTTALAQLSRMIIDGQMLGLNSFPSDADIQRFIEQAIYAWLIPKAWSLSTEGYHPFILDSGTACTDGNPLPDYISDSTAHSTSVCYQNVLYYFVSVSGDYRDCQPGPCELPSCVNNRFTALPGMSALDEKTYGGVSKTDLVIGALAGYTANGNKNGWPAADPSQATTVSNLYDSGIHSPGVVMIPICSAKVAFLNWAAADISQPGYPCQAQSPSKRREIMQKRELREAQELRERVEAENRLGKRVCAK